MTRVILVVAMATVVAAQDVQRPVFRATAEAVTIDVSVADGKRPVDGLTAADFELVDNDVEQKIDQATADQAGIDIDVLLDVSGSAMGGFGSHLLTLARKVAAMVSRQDSAQLVEFGRRVRLTVDPLADVEAMVPPRLADGGSHLFDAICAVAMRKHDPGRRHIVVVITDGLDTQSFIGRETRQRILAKSSSIVSILALSLQGRTNNWSYQIRPLGAPRNVLEIAGNYDYLLSELTDATGGLFYDVRQDGSLPESLKSLLELSRHRYLLTYRPLGVDQSGWHNVKVTIKNHKYTVHARRGYFSAP